MLYKLDQGTARKGDLREVEMTRRKRGEECGDVEAEEKGNVVNIHGVDF